MPIPHGRAATIGLITLLLTLIIAAGSAADDLADRSTVVNRSSHRASSPERLDVDQFTLRAKRSAGNSGRRSTCG